MKVVINRCYGGYGLSEIAIRWLRERGHQGAFKEVLIGEFFVNSLGEKSENTYLRTSYLHETPRTDPLLIECIEALGEYANGECANLHVVEIPDGTDYVIEEYDGIEWIAESHRTWS